MTKNDYTKSLDFPRSRVYAHPMSMKIYNKGRFLPSLTLIPGETVFDLDGYIRTVAWVGTHLWGSTDGFTHSGAHEALDVTDHPVARIMVTEELEKRGAL